MGQKFKSKKRNCKGSRRHVRVTLLPRNGKIISIIIQNEKARREKKNTHFMYLKKSLRKNALSRVKRQMTLGEISATYHRKKANVFNI